jgi:hypothetical protein
VVFNCFFITDQHLKSSVFAKAVSVISGSKPIAAWPGCGSSAERRYPFLFEMPVFKEVGRFSPTNS